MEFLIGAFIVGFIAGAAVFSTINTILTIIFIVIRKKLMGGLDDHKTFKDRISVRGFRSIRRPRQA